MSKSSQQAESGAPDALRWIEDQERRAREDYENCLAILKNTQRDRMEDKIQDDGANWERLEGAAKGHLKDAEDRVTKWQKSLREFTKAVPEEKRDTTEKITQNDGIKLLQTFWIYETQACESLINAFSQDVLHLRLDAENMKPEDVYELFRVKLIETKANAMQLAIGEAHLPPWVGKALEGVL